MANDFTKVPYKVDTVMATTFRNTAGALAGAGSLYIKKVEWVGPTGIGDAYEIQSDIPGNVIDSNKCGVAGVGGERNFNPPLDVRDFKVTVLGSGTLLIYPAA